MSKKFSHKGYYINEETFEVQGKQYENRLVGRVIYPSAQTPSIGGVLINAIAFIAGLYGIFTFSTIGVILGLLGFGVGGFNLYHMFKEFKNPKYVVMVNVKPEHTVRLEFNDKPTAIEFCQILETQRALAIIQFEEN